MPAVCLCLHFHQPYRLRHYSVFDTASDYFDLEATSRVLDQTVESSYLPTASALLKVARKKRGAFQLALCASGCALEQLGRRHQPLIDQFKELTAMGCARWIAQPYYHSFASLFSRGAFVAQVKQHLQLTSDLFGCEPTVLANTELIYRNELAAYLSDLPKIAGMIVPGRPPGSADDQSAEPISAPVGTAGQQAPDIKLLPRDEALCRMIRDRGRDFTLLLRALDSQGDVRLIFLPIEDFMEGLLGEEADTDALTGHLEKWVDAILDADHTFDTPGRCIARSEVGGSLDVPGAISWAEPQTDLSVWMGNAMQGSAFRELYKLRETVYASGDQALLTDWLRLSSADHFFYMCTRYFADGQAHKFYSPYESPYDSYINFMNVLDHIRERAERAMG